MRLSLTQGRQSSAAGDSLSFMDSENNFDWKQCLDVCSHPGLWGICSCLNHPHYKVSFKVFIQFQFPFLHLVTFASHPFPMQPSEGASCSLYPPEDSTGLHSHLHEGAQLLSCLICHSPQIILVVLSHLCLPCPAVQSETLYSTCHLQVPTKDLMASLGLLTVIPWTQCGLQP